MRTRLMLAAGVTALTAFAQVATVVTQNGPGAGPGTGNVMFYSVESAGP